ncbi:hypothetical protein HZC30_08060 [Candidatus Woesearchaeota archaeon]|nr:hypothetical protein [Candidatus Woesearchaeota archaeon]
MKTTLKITSTEKITTIRLSESAKRELESFGHAGQTHEEILLGVLRQLKNLKLPSKTNVTATGEAIGIKYGRLNRTLNIEIDQEKYSLVCIFNDISFIPFTKSTEWELDLEIANIKIGSGSWKDPLSLNSKTRLLLYFIALKQILEDLFNIKLYEILNLDDYLNYDKWKAIYTIHQLSMESFRTDAEEKLRNVQ